MSNALPRIPTIEAFLEWERAQEIRHEFDGVAAVAMTGGSLRHRAIADNLTRALNDQVLAKGCRAFAGDVKVIAAGRVRYPDVVVTCAAMNLDEDLLASPAVVVEVLSPATARVDRIVKPEEYRQTPSIAHYLLLEQETAEGILFTRDGQVWRAEVVSASSCIALPGLGASIAMADVYRELMLIAE